MTASSAGIGAAMSFNDALLIKQAVFRGCDDHARDYLLRKGYASGKGGFHVLVEAADASAARLASRYRAALTGEPEA